MHTLISIIIIVLYFAVGCAVNGLLGDDTIEFSIILLIFWPLMLAVIVLLGIMYLFYKIGKILKTKLEEHIGV